MLFDFSPSHIYRRELGVFCCREELKHAQTDFLHQSEASTWKMKGGGGLARLADHGSAPTDLSFGREADKWALKPSARGLELG